MNNTLTKIHYLHISVNNYAMPTQHQQGINWIMAPQIYLSKHKHHPTYHDTTKYTTHLGKSMVLKSQTTKIKLRGAVLIKNDPKSWKRP